MHLEDLKQLLKQNEDVSLEFKSQIDLSSKEGKATLLKEVLALTNVPVSPSFLVIGVKDKTKEVVGCSPISEEQLQQLLSHYCKPPIPFSYEAFEVEGKQIGVIQIFRSDLKPHTLKTRFAYAGASGKAIEISESQVFIRRGSIVGEATREELIAMAQDRDTNTEFLAREVVGIEKMAKALRSVSGHLEGIEEEVRKIRYSTYRYSDPSIEATAVSIVTGGLMMLLLDVNRLSLVAAPLLWFTTSIVLSALRLVQAGSCRILLNSIFLSSLLGIVLWQVDTTGVLDSLMPGSSVYISLLHGVLIGAITGGLGSRLLSSVELRFR